MIDTSTWPIAAATASEPHATRIPMMVATSTLTPRLLRCRLGAMNGALVSHDPALNLVERLQNAQLVAARQRDDRVRRRLDVLDQVGIQHDGLSVQTVE